MVRSYSILIFVCTCDNCGDSVRVEKDMSVVYNNASAVRSIGWSFGRNGKVTCHNCRKKNLNDKYRYK